MAEKKNKKNGLSAGNGSVVIGGNVQGSNIVLGNNNTISNQSVNVTPLFSSHIPFRSIHCQNCKLEKNWM